jgi:hypothetical protein
MPAFATIRLVTLAGALVLAAGACSRVRPGTGAEGGVRHGADLIAQMHDRYAAAVPKSLAFTQSNTVYTGTGQVKQSARVLVDPPARMRVDFLPLSGRSSAFYVGSRSQTIAGGRRSDAVEQANPALVFAYTVFAAPPDSVRRVLEEMGIDLSRVRRDEFNGAEAWVIGARDGDLTSNQVWISTRRLLPLRHIRREERKGEKVVTDTRFGTFREFGKFPMATSIEVHRDGRLVMKQAISKVRTNVPVPSGAFDASRGQSISVRR